MALAIRDQRSTAMRTGYTVSVTDPTVLPLLPDGTKLADVAFGERGLVFFPERHLDGRHGWCWRRATGGAPSTSIG